MTFEDFDPSWGVWLVWNGAGIHFLVQEASSMSRFAEKLSSLPHPDKRIDCAICKKPYGSGYDIEDRCPRCGTTPNK